MVFSFVYSDAIIQLCYYIHRINHVSVYYAEIMEIFLGYVFFSSCVLLCPFKILFALNFSNIITFSLPVSTEPSSYMCVILVSFYGMFYCCLLNNQTLKLITKSNRVSLSTIARFIL